jgi:FAD synthase
MGMHKGHNLAKHIFLEAILKKILEISQSIKNPLRVLKQQKYSVNHQRRKQNIVNLQTLAKRLRKLVRGVS